MEAGSNLTDNSINIDPNVDDVSQESTDTLPGEIESYLEDEAYLVNTCITSTADPDVKEMKFCPERSTNLHPGGVILPENHIRLEK